MNEIKATILALALFPLMSQASDIKVISTVAMKSVLESMKPALEKSGDKITVEYGLSGELKEKLLKGELTCDVMISTKAGIEDLIKSGKLVPEGAVDINKSGVGLAVKNGEPKPAMSNDSDVKKILLEAKSVTYPKQGATLGVMNSVYQKLGITDEMQAKIKFPESGDAMETVARGESQYVFTQLSEILASPGIEHVAQLPSSLQKYTVFTSALCAGASNAVVGQRFIKVLTQPDTMKIYQSKGLEPI